jgi:hypothetical protein
MKGPAAIPWCLAAMGFLGALTVLTWQGRRDDPGQKLQPRVTMAYRFTPSAVDHHELRSAQAPPASEPAQDLPATLILPLPPATQPDPDPNVQPVPDDAPTVEDLPARRL